MKVFADNWTRSITIEIEDADFYRERSKKTGKVGGALMPTKNRAFMPSKGGGKHISPRQFHFRRLIAGNCAGLEVGLGAYRLDVEQTCRQRAQIGALYFPQPDSDATLSAIRDALQARVGFKGLVLEDAQITENEISATISEAKPRECGLRIELTAIVGAA